MCYGDFRCILLFMSHLIYIAMLINKHIYHLNIIPRHTKVINILLKITTFFLCMLVDLFINQEKVTYSLDFQKRAKIYLYLLLLR